MQMASIWTNCRIRYDNILLKMNVRDGLKRSLSTRFYFTANHLSFFEVRPPVYRHLFCYLSTDPLIHPSIQALICPDLVCV